MGWLWCYCGGVGFIGIIHIFIHFISSASIYSPSRYIFSAVDADFIVDFVVAVVVAYLKPVL